MLKRLLLAGGFALALVASTTAQNAELTIDGGSLGSPLSYRLSNAGANKAFIMLFSLQRGSLPLALIDPGDPRFVRVGLELGGINVIGGLDATGTASFTVPLPPDSNLIGLSLLHQALSLPGTTRKIHEVSGVAVAILGSPNTWQQPTPKMVSVRGFHTMLPLEDGYRLLVGGGQGSIFAPMPWKTTEFWDAQNKRFGAGPSLVNARAVHTQTRLPDGRYLLTGGVDALNAPQSSCEIFDPKTNTFAAAASMRAPRMAHTATLLSSGKVLVTGGIISLADVTTAVTTSLNTSEIYDPATNTWSPGPNMTRPRATHGGIRIDKDRILVCGGITWRNFIFFRIPSITNTAEVYDERTNRFSSVGSMPTARALFGLAQFASGKVIAAAGISGDIVAGGTPTAACALFDPTTNGWTAAAPVAGARAMPAGVLLRDGRYAVFGGGNGNLFAPGPVDTCEAYDPVTNKWTALAKMSITRLTPAVGLLESGAVFINGGGSGASANAVDTQEIYLR